VCSVDSRAVVSYGEKSLKTSLENELVKIKTRTQPTVLSSNRRAL